MIETGEIRFEPKIDNFASQPICANSFQNTKYIYISIR